MDLQLAHSEARRLMDLHGFASWNLNYFADQKTFGRCIYRTKTILLSHPLVAINVEERVKDVILHEIAHAYCPGQSHNHVWMRKASELGCTPKECYSFDNTVSALPWVGVCPMGHVHYKSRYLGEVRSCMVCAKKFNPQFVIKWEYRPIQKASAMDAALVTAMAKLQR